LGSGGLGCCDWGLSAIAIIIQQIVKTAIQSIVNQKRQGADSALDESGRIWEGWGKEFEENGFGVCLEKKGARPLRAPPLWLWLARVVLDVDLAGKFPAGGAAVLAG
jgi:hypothetical protein